MHSQIETEQHELERRLEENLSYRDRLLSLLRQFGATPKQDDRLVRQRTEQPAKASTWYYC